MAGSVPCGRLASGEVVLGIDDDDGVAVVLGSRDLGTCGLEKFIKIFNLQLGQTK